MSQPSAPRKTINIKAITDPDNKVYPRSISGPFTTWRWIFVWLTQIVFYGLCWLPWHGRQAVLFDIDARKFYFFDLVLWPQDTIYLVLLMILGALALFLFTAVAGRLWCGYSCPQTVYTEIFLWFEKVIEGERPKRMKLDAEPWSARKLGIKTAKHSVWILFSLWTGITFVGYFMPIHELINDLVSLSPGAWSAFWVVFYAFATYGNAGFLRDQMCRQICPYARFQFVMFDPDTLIIAYDAKRGESRGPRAKNADSKAQGLGDCVDCGICVQVCPTGIDIRNGLQNECIGCAACIDACDQVMDKMNYPRGLIRYSTENAVTRHYSAMDILRRAVRPRVIIYAAILALLTFATAWSLATRIPLKVNILKDRSSLSREADDGSIENIYRLQIMNTGDQTRRFRITISGNDNLRLGSDEEITVAGGEIGIQSAIVRAESGSIPSGATPLSFSITDIAENHVAVTEKTKFWMP
ncbi:cytochrome c oxidase accessory protein CcoG [Dechloromonas sp. TW-R-39-2]|uniref:cytochrome c oxidase accessory protein CcoG n=1 Tax=Dechloromonas sp. TW-R-39-2 TaxID=2654218 RepID=UPI00193DAE47|nr:cytochrome c oxidase accessory protein CcoG [Dechloromonas sp. TW-R-39-2]QRM17888.1 cytochrome c oxidase accessory protein CcoG [Dechloromonas sp. TW-R-39-2]